ncbi:MAG: thiamine phosphate synthase [bacterium]
MKKLVDYSLFMVTHDTVTVPGILESVIHKAIRGGVTVILLRENDLQVSIREVIAKATKIKELLAGTSIPLIINDRVDIALASGADGVHIGQTDMPYADVRRLMGPDAIIGLTVENISYAIQAEKYDVDYFKVSQIFPSLTRPVNRPAWQLEGLERLRKISKKTLVAVGGITQYNVADVMSAGADGIAVVSAICHQPDPENAACKLAMTIKQVKDLRCVVSVANREAL